MKYWHFVIVGWAGRHPKVSVFDELENLTNWTFTESQQWLLVSHGTHAEGEAGYIHITRQGNRMTEKEGNACTLALFHKRVIMIRAWWIWHNSYLYTRCMFDVLIFGLVFLLLLEIFTDYRVAFGRFWTLSTQDSNHTCHCRACGPIVVPWCINMGAAFPFHKRFDLMKIQVGSKTAVFIKRLWHGVSVQALTFFSFTQRHKHTVSLVKVLWFFDPSIGPNLHSAQTFSLCIRGHLKTVYARPRLCHAKLDFDKCTACRFESKTVLFVRRLNF